jgi:universal stress protein E
MPPTTDFYRCILVAIDFSRSANAALEQAICLAKQHRSRLVLVHALRDLRQAVHQTSYEARLNFLYGDGVKFQQEIRRTSDEKMRQLLAQRDVTGLEVKSETVTGDPIVALIRAVQQESCDLVLAGTRGLSGWEQFFVGSTAKRLIHNCPASVWIVKSEHAGTPTKVLAATDFSEVSRKAVLEGLRLADEAGADFHLLHVVDSIDASEDVLDEAPRGDSLRRHINDEAKRRLKDFMESLNVEPSRIHSHLTWGTPSAEIDRLAQHLKIDLVVMGTVGRSGIRGLLLGNTAESVLGTCDCSILTVKPDGFVSPVEPASWPPLTISQPDKTASN